MSQNSINEVQKEEITLKELIRRIQEFSKEIWKNKIWVIVSVILFAAIMVGLASLEPIAYRGKITFMLDDDDRGGFGGVAAILGQFGINGTRGAYNLNKILDLSKSRAITQMALFEKVVVENREDYLANHIILEYNYHKDWEENKKGLKEFFFTHDSIPSFRKIENKALKKLHKHVVGTEKEKGLMSSSIDTESGIMSISVKTTSEDISLQLTEVIYEKLTNFYTLKAIEKQRSTYQLFKAKTDSIQRALNNAQYRLYKFQDSNRGLIRQQDEIEKKRLEQEVQKLILTFGETYKNLELADFALKSQTPFIQLIDAPLPPLEGVLKSKTKALISGILIGLILSFLFIVVRKILREALI